MATQKATHTNTHFIHVEINSVVTYQVKSTRLMFPLDLECLADFRSAIRGVRKHTQWECVTLLACPLPASSPNLSHIHRLCCIVSVEQLDGAQVNGDMKLSVLACVSVSVGVYQAV